MKSDVSIAAALIEYRNELVAGDIPTELANEMTRDAAGRVIQSQGASALENLASS